MKMTNKQYNQLKADVIILAEYYGYTKPVLEAAAKDDGRAHRWALFHRVNHHRSYADDHPMWNHAKRMLEPSHVGKELFITELYDSGLDDTHIDTAMKKIMKELSK